jgi:signal-transduction protein with cAMP-binding, CBS, and nucleotidyltransferase domain
LSFWLEHAEPKIATVRNFVKRDAVIIDANNSVLDAAQLMRDKNVGNCLVSINGQPVGIVTERDMLNRIAAENLLSSSIPIRKIMSSPMISVTADTPLSEAVKLMAKHHIRTLFVTDNGKPMGLLNMRAIVGDQFRAARMVPDSPD